MSKIRPFWRIVIGAILLLNLVWTSNELAFGGSFVGFAFWGAALAAYIFLAIKIPYDDPVRSMRDLMARQAEEQAAGKADAPAASQDAQTRIAALEAELADLKEQLNK